jgi:hypothetical protein
VAHAFDIASGAQPFQFPPGCVGAVDDMAAVRTSCLVCPRGRSPRSWPHRTPRLPQILTRFTFRIPVCERGLKALCNYHTVHTTSTGLAVDEPVHLWTSYAADAFDMAFLLESARKELAIKHPAQYKIFLLGTHPLLVPATLEQIRIKSDIWTGSGFIGDGRRHFEIWSDAFAAADWHHFKLAEVILPFSGRSVI